ncbi:hypothetical protein WN51_13911 [Melipona quadrifasciata]|uniref:Uncharacterized protein n=1 Tax=Melipona quadrifasciata TaxID=166423 RepID=A0A0M9A196_9HYME|nr:hypothetical protein WN51_13911 [Melipona quadrifasciata]
MEFLRSESAIGYRKEINPEEPEDTKVVGLDRGSLLTFDVFGDSLAVEGSRYTGSCFHWTSRGTFFEASNVIGYRWILVPGIEQIDMDEDLLRRKYTEQNGDKPALETLSTGIQHDSLSPSLFNLDADKTELQMKCEETEIIPACLYFVFYRLQMCSIVSHVRGLPITLKYTDHILRRTRKIGVGTADAGPKERLINSSESPNQEDFKVTKLQATFYRHDVLSPHTDHSILTDPIFYDEQRSHVALKEAFAAIIRDNHRCPGILDYRRSSERQTVANGPLSPGLVRTLESHVKVSKDELE